MLTEKELQEIRQEAGKEYPDMLWKQKVHIAALTKERERTRATIETANSIINSWKKDRERTKELVEALEKARMEIIELTDCETSGGNKMFYPKYIDKALSNYQKQINP